MSTLIAQAQPFVLRPYSKAELCQLFNISPYILKKWVEAQPEIGKPIGNTFSIRQVELFTKFYGVPGLVIRDAA